MANVQNPAWVPHRDLGFTDVQWDALKTLVTDHLAANAGSSTLDVTELRLLDAAFADDLTWNQMAGDLQLSELPEGVG